MTRNEGSGQLIQKMQCDAKLLRIFDRLKEPPMIIPPFEADLKKVMVNHHMDKGALLATFNGIESLNRQLELTKVLQHHIDAIVELNFSIDSYHHKWSEQNHLAHKHINTEYGDELNVYKDSTRTGIISAVITPIEQGMALLNFYRKSGEKIQNDLINSSWTLREVNGLMKEILQHQRLVGGSTAIV